MNGFSFDGGNSCGKRALLVVDLLIVVVVVVLVFIAIVVDVKSVLPSNCG